jgi:hypothetical protein
MQLELETKLQEVEARTCLGCVGNTVTGTERIKLLSFD